MIAVVLTLLAAAIGLVGARQIRTRAERNRRKAERMARLRSRVRRKTTEYFF